MKVRAKFVQQTSRRDDIGSFQSLGEPGVDWRQHLTRRVVSTLVALELSQADRGPQFPKLRVLLPCLHQTCFEQSSCLISISRAVTGLQAYDLRLAPLLSSETDQFGSAVEQIECASDVSISTFNLGYRSH